MNTFDAFLTMERHVDGQEDSQLHEAWTACKDVVARCLHSLPPSGVEGARIELARNAHLVLRTDENERNVLLFRLLKTAEALAGIVGKELTARGCCSNCGGPLDVQGECIFFCEMEKQT